MKRDDRRPEWLMLAERIRVQLPGVPWVPLGGLQFRPLLGHPRAANDPAGPSVAPGPVKA